jgi:hypothetical protein
MFGFILLGRYSYYILALRYSARIEDAFNLVGPAPNGSQFTILMYWFWPGRVHLPGKSFCYQGKTVECPNV